MADARRIHDWNQTSLMWSLIANVNRSPEAKGEPYHPREVHPYMEQPELPMLDELPGD